MSVLGPNKHVVAVVGRPNVGKSTLESALVGLDLSIATPKAQTTQHRILAINSTDTHQTIFVDTPGLLLPKDLLQTHMLSEIQRAVEVSNSKTQERLLRVEAAVYVARESQKGILIGRKGQALKKLGTSARKDMEVFFGQKVYLGLQAKVVPNWKRKKEGLHQVGFLRHRG